MSLSRTYMSSSVFQTCLTHAFSTEREEIMGLLLGRWTKVKEKDVAYIEAISISRRLDKLKDRVEISPEQLMHAMNEGEKLKLNVIGWYHSHPHLIVSPSTVDLRTQLNMQTLDHRFFGIIFSCFNQEDNVQRLNITCFQSSLIDSCPGHLEIPLIITDDNTYPDYSLYQLSELPNILFSEEKNSFEESLQKKDIKDGLDSTLANKLTYQHNSFIYMEGISNIVDKLSMPIYQNIESINSQLKDDITKLQERKNNLLNNK
ncbi:lys-63-specific deubiquitinase BRCC36-like protein [Piromyces finnis]|uniref:Lys-63-specific deubiquitinase BRCC36-like protein n=1 Tax=Piromyces finnis TaxID=1754191 RepID=A0A1Y1VDD9_9FUNG|nr:lys-63-specific deubiquitinase BRCC36-like protein [Piromyces finnis]|eukprot:ORX53419.1 lys-63-specific deubiquitinase BRCC36-like protein [Piromyces finnis]